MDKINQALKTDTKPSLAKELQPNALCIPLTKQVCEYIETANDVMNRIASLENNCNLASCRYNENGKCTNEEKRKECVDVSKLVLCLEEK